MPTTPTTGTPTWATGTSGPTVVDTPTVNDGDQMLAFGISGVDSTGKYYIPPAGWVELSAEYLLIASFSYWFHVWRKVASSEGSTQTFAHNAGFNRGKVVIVPIYGAADPTLRPVVLSQSTDVSWSDKKVTCPSVTSVYDSSLLIRGVVDPNPSASSTPPSGHTEIYDNGTISSIWIATKSLDAGSSGAADFTASLNWHQAVTYSIAFAPTAPPTGKRGIKTGGRLGNAGILTGGQL